MNIIKKIIFFSLIFIITGCSVEYNLNINEDGSVNEIVVAQERTNKMESITRKKGQQAVDYLYETFKRDNESKIVTNNSDDKTTSTVTKKYINIDQYTSNFKSDIFENINISKEKDEVTLEAKQSKALGNDYDYSPIYNDITINIKLPFKVIKNNADSISNNVYTWNIKENELKNIELVYSDNYEVEKVNVKINNKTYNFSYGIIAIGSAVVLIITIVLIVFIKNRKNNIV